MKILVVVLAALSMATLNGCVAEWFVIRTVDEIKRSEYRAEYTSTQAPEAVTRCMMQTLYNHKNATGAQPYAAVASQAYGGTQAITLRTSENLATRMYGGGNELLFLIENSGRENGGTKSSLWVNHQFLSPSPRDYLGIVAGIVRVCL